MISHTLNHGTQLIVVFLVLKALSVSIFNCFSQKQKQSAFVFSHSGPPK